MLVPEQASGAVTPPTLSASIMATAAFLLCSALAIPLVRTIRLKPFTPHWGADIVSVIGVSRAVLFVPLVGLSSWRGRGVLDVSQPRPSGSPAGCV